MLYTPPFLLHSMFMLCLKEYILIFRRELFQVKFHNLWFYPKFQSTFKRSDSTFLISIRENLVQIVINFWFFKTGREDLPPGIESNEAYLYGFTNAVEMLRNDPATDIGGEGVFKNMNVIEPIYAGNREIFTEFSFYFLLIDWFDFIRIILLIP